MSNEYECELNDEFEGQGPEREETYDSKEQESIDFLDFPDLWYK